MERYWKCKDHDWGNGPSHTVIYYSKDCGGKPQNPPHREGNPMRDTSMVELMPEGFVPS